MQPTNAELKDSFDRHATEDHTFQTKQVKTNEEMTQSLASIHKRLNELPTKEDIPEIIASVFKFSFNNAGKITSFVILLIGVYGLFKFGVVGAVAWFFKIINGN